MKLYLIRHGESEANIKRCFAGQSQAMLTQNGIMQAEKTHELIKHIKFDLVYSSDLYRAMDTQKKVLPGALCTVTPLIREINVGDALIGKCVDDCFKEYPGFESNVRSHNYSPYGGESEEQIKARAREFLDEVIKTDAENIAAFSHGGFISTVLRCIAGTDLDAACDNCAINVFEYRNGRWRLVHWNYTYEIK